jgi:carboxypeptidase Taq
VVRLEAGELTYHLRIVVRYEIERDLVRGDLAVEEVPEVWNDKMEAYLGIRPDSDAEGCLQDIHWSHGAFGYFPTYSLGSVLAAQFHHHARSAIDGFESSIAARDFGPIHRWLRSNVHAHGCRYTTPELIEVATGEAFNAEHFIDYVTRKFGSLYGLD